MSINQSRLTPTEIGTVLGMSLVEGKNIEILHETEISLISGAGISKTDYIIERFVLSACAAAHAAGSYFSPNERKMVASGFMDWFQRGAASTPAFKLAYESFAVRVPIYSAAATQDRNSGRREQEAVTFPALTLAFGDALFTKAKRSEEAEGLCRVLASAITESLWSAQVEGSIALFTRTGGSSGA